MINTTLTVLWHSLEEFAAFNFITSLNGPIKNSPHDNRSNDGWIARKWVQGVCQELGRTGTKKVLKQENEKKGS